MVACRYGISLLVFNSTPHSFAALTRELSSYTLEEKFHIYARQSIILYITKHILCILAFLFSPSRYSVELTTAAI